MTTAPPPAVEEWTLTCLEYVRRALGVSLDFTPETLSLLDHYAGLDLEAVPISREDLTCHPASEPVPSNR